MPVLRLCLGAIVLGLIHSSGQGQPMVSWNEAPAFGTATTTYVSIGDWEFVDLQGTPTYYPAQGGQPKLCLFPEQQYEAAVRVPGGALLTYLQLDGCDTDPASDMTLKLYDLSSLNVITATLATITSTGPPGCASPSMDLAPLGYTVDNKTRRLLIEVTTDQAVGGCALTLFAAVIGYKLQVSQPPATATFNDVPTNHQFFQFVEALAAAGVTAGCGGGNYCPDFPVTRGQMAAFLSKSLGLSWSQ